MCQRDITHADCITNLKRKKMVPKRDGKWWMKAMNIEGKYQIVVISIGHLQSPITTTRIGSTSYVLRAKLSTGEHRYKLRYNLMNSMMEFCMEY